MRLNILSEVILLHVELVQGDFRFDW